MTTTHVARLTSEYDLTVDKQGVRLVWQDQTFLVEPHDLIDGGWHRDIECDPCEEPHVRDLPAIDPVAVLRRWHGEKSGHTGAFRFCDEQPCQALRQELEQSELWSA